MVLATKLGIRSTPLSAVPNCLQVGYVTSPMGEHGNPAELRHDAGVLAEAIQGAVAEYGNTCYLAAQQAGMQQDASWDLPAQEWEEVHSYTSFLQT